MTRIIAEQQNQQQGEQQQLFDGQSSTTSTTTMLRTTKPPSSQLDVVRYSMANATDQMDLDTILAELLELEDQLSGAASDQLVYGLPVLPKTSANRFDDFPTGTTTARRTPNLYDDSSHVRLISSSSATSHQPQDLAGVSGGGCTSPDGDSAFGDASSADGSSGSSSMGSVAGGATGGGVHLTAGRLYGYSHSQFFSIGEQSGAPSPTSKIFFDSTPDRISTALTAPSPSLTASASDDERTQKIREALEKMREAKMKKIYIKVFLENGATKGVLVDERWTVGETRAQIADRVGCQLAADHAIVEECPDLHIARVYEDHEFTVENLEQWAAESKNKIHFRRVADRFDFIERPENFLAHLPSQSVEAQSSPWDQPARDALIKRLLEDQSTSSAAELDGWLTLKVDGRKSWRRHYFVLRSSGLYYHPKAGKRNLAVKDLQCLMNVYNNQVYVGVDWRKKYKAPTEYGFAVKHPRIQVKNSKYIKYICAEDEPTLNRWLAALRVVKNGFKQLYDNYLAAGHRNSTSSGNVATVDTITSRCLRVDVPDVSTRLSVTPFTVSERGSQMSDASAGRFSLRGAPLSPRQFATVGGSTQTLMRQAAPFAFVVPTSSTNSSRECSPGIFFDKDECGTIKRQPYGVPFGAGGNGSGIVSPCPTAGVSASQAGERDSDEEEDFDYDEQFPPPPVQCAVLATPPAPSVGCDGGEASPASRKIPPPPPKRSAHTTPRLQQLQQQKQSNNNQQQQQLEEQQRQQQINGLFAELQKATIRQKQKLEQT